MAPLICLIAAFIFFRLLGLLWPWFSDWHSDLRAALGVMFLLTASAHWGRRRADLIRMVPGGLRDPGMWVSLTGIAEIALGAGLQIPALVPAVGIAGVTMLGCLFPANVRAAREHLTINRKPVLPLLPRLAVQIVFVVALIASAWPH